MSVEDEEEPTWQICWVFGNEMLLIWTGVGTLAVPAGSGSYTAGTSGAGTLGATLNMASGATLTMLDGAIGTLNINQNTSFATTGSAHPCISGCAAPARSREG